MTLACTHTHIHIHILKCKKNVKSLLKSKSHILKYGFVNKLVPAFASILVKEEQTQKGFKKK